MGFGMVGNLTDNALTENTYAYYINKCFKKIHVISRDFISSIKIEMREGVRAILTSSS